MCYCAGLVPFAIGSETAGSITYPAARCGVTALRPTFGTVGRTGVLSLSESLVLLFSMLICFAGCESLIQCIRRINWDLSAEVLQIAQSFWMQSEARIQMIFHPETSPFLIHLMLISQS